MSISSDAPSGIVAFMVVDISPVASIFPALNLAVIEIAGPRSQTPGIFIFLIMGTSIRGITFSTIALSAVPCLTSGPRIGSVPDNFLL
jgi:hypothetical protein